jgi:hypothetical protein
LRAESAIISGDINATSGSLDGLVISGNLDIIGGSITVGDSLTGVTIDSNGIRATVEIASVVIPVFDLNLTTKILTVEGVIKAEEGHLRDLTIIGELAITDGVITTGTATDGFVIDSTGIVGTVDSIEIFNLDLVGGELSLTGNINASSGKIANWNIRTTAIDFNVDGAGVSVDSGKTGRTLTGITGSYDTAGVYIDNSNYLLLVTQGDFSPQDASSVFRAGGATSYFRTNLNGDAIFVPPTSTTGLPSGAIWNDNGIPKIV